MAEAHAQPQVDDSPSRRDFLYIATTAAVGVGGLISLWPFVDQMNPSADVQALTTAEVDLAPIELGQTVKVVWQKKPVYIRRRTPEQIAAAEEFDNNAQLLADLPDPQPDIDRVIKPEWLVVVGVCTHLGCIPDSDPDNLRGEFGGWFCPCHGSQYDDSGRIRKGPAPENLAVPPYTFTSDTTIRIG